MLRKYEGFSVKEDIAPLLRTCGKQEKAIHLCKW